MKTDITRYFGPQGRDLMRGSIYVMRRINGVLVPLRLQNQTRYREWLGCFSAI